MTLDQLNDFLQDQCPIVPHIQRYYPDIDLRDDGNGQWSAAGCPWSAHSSKRGKTRLNVNEAGPWRCWSCDEIKGFGAVAWEMQDQAIGFGEAIRYLADQYGFQLPNSKPYTPEQIAENDKKATGQRILNAAAEYYHNQLIEYPHARDYYNDRGLSDKSINQNLLGYAGTKRDGLTKALSTQFDLVDILKTGLCFSDRDGKVIDRWHNGYVLPYHINRNNVSFFAWRNAIAGEEPKYKKLPTDAESAAVVHSVLGIYNLNNTVDKPILMVEGVIDYYLAQQEFGSKNIVLSPGTVQPSSEQIDIIAKRLAARKVSSTIVICMDADDGGRAGAIKTAKAIESAMQQVMDQDKPKPQKKKGPGRPSKKANLDPRMPRIFIARLQKDFDGNSVDLADYIKQGRIEDLRDRISPFNAPSIQATELYEKGDPTFALSLIHI